MNIPQNPRLGNQRQKQKRSQVLQQLGRSSPVSRFGPLGVARAGVRGAARGGTRIFPAGGIRPGSSLVPTRANRGLGRGLGQAAELFYRPEAPSVAPSAPRPSDPLPPGGFGGGGGGAAGVPAGGFGGGGSMAWDAQGNPYVRSPEDTQAILDQLGAGASVNPNTGSIFEGDLPQIVSQSSPSSPLLGGQNLIPLGGGLYYNVQTGEVMGAGSRAAQGLGGAL